MAAPARKDAKPERVDKGDGQDLGGRRKRCAWRYRIETGLGGPNKGRKKKFSTISLKASQGGGLKSERSKKAFATHNLDGGEGRKSHRRKEEATRKVHCWKGGKTGRALVRASCGGKKQEREKGKPTEDHWGSNRNESGHWKSRP